MLNHRLLCLYFRIISYLCSMKYHDWKGFIMKKCAEENDFSHMDDPLYLYKEKQEPIDAIREFYDNLTFPEWYLSEKRLDNICSKFIEGPFNAIRQYFDIININRKNSDSIDIENSKYIIEPDNQFVYREWNYPCYHKNAFSFDFMFFIRFDMKIENYKVRERIFDILAYNPIPNHNIISTFEDKRYDYYHFRPHISKYKYAKIPVIRKLTGIKDTNWIIGFEVIYRMHLNKLDGNNNKLYVYSL